ncbi:hypothetical protein [Chitinophaga ginsengisoli]|uniref:Uncharacterized protein n=1 Tax=Chitinophaga ginsengisoli TaxID=363837 RepID=A0A2P8G4Q0_9BACT|nr:hypothetical protein [Chitinophaga ginsengisoli]PSL28949.1 hypothetical protein CLV42_10795 [Chitinophaga ginsengisoli]
MLIKELQILSEALWEAVKRDADFFSSITSFVKKLSEFNYSNLKKDNLTEIKIYTDNIEAFFTRYRPTGKELYLPPAAASNAYVQREKGYKKVPKIVLSGLWLKVAYFNCREKVHVDVTTKGITIEKLSLKSSKAVLIHLYQAPHNIFTMHEYPAFIC